MRKRTKKHKEQQPPAKPTHVSAPAEPAVLGPGKKLGTMEVAARLGCHPMTVPRLVEAGRISKPLKWLGKNLWTEEQLAADIAKLLARAGRSTEVA
jgi:hypothetical protein